MLLAVVVHCCYMVTLTVTLMSGHSLWHLSVVEGDPSNFEELAGSSLQQLEALLQQAVPGLQKQEKITLQKKSAINCNNSCSQA